MIAKLSILFTSYAKKKKICYLLASIFAFRLSRRYQHLYRGQRRGYQAATVALTHAPSVVHGSASAVVCTYTCACMMDFTAIHVRTVAKVTRRL